ncbi:MAG: dynamin family protein [Desulfamplus sp.]|nr:dynamin family protein [Desulfamplus sp.]
MNSYEAKMQEFGDNSIKLVMQLERLGIKQFDGRIANFKRNMTSLMSQIVRSGLVGITSSGKSSLLNVILGTGDKILKEQSKATTNMIVFCSKTDVPSLEIHFENREPVKKQGDIVFSESIWKYTSEDENPGNKYSVKHIKLGLPSFLFDKGLEIADTPGLDAYGHQAHEDLTLREFLPQADLIIYLSSIRSPMKEADRKILNKIMDADQQIIFIQTCKGAVVEQQYGDGADVSTASLLENYKKEFKAAISPYSNIKNAPIVQVETRLALQYFKNKDESDWEESGFAELTQCISDISSQLKRRLSLLELRKRSSELNTLNKLILNSINKASEKEKGIIETNDLLNKLKYYFDRIEKDKNTIIEKWKGNLNYLETYNKIKKELQEAATEDHFYVISATVEERASKLKNEFLDAMDSSKNTYRHYFAKLGLDVRRIDLQEVAKGIFHFPNVEKKIREKEISPKDSADKKPKTRRELFIDKASYYINLEKTLKNYFEPLLRHIDWWENTITSSFVQPLQVKISALENDLSNLRKNIHFDRNVSEELISISSEIDRVIDEVSSLCKDPSKQEIVVSKFKKKAFTSYKRNIEHRNLFIQLGTLLYENMFHTSYLNTVSRISGNKEKCIVLIGQDYNSQIAFLRRLMRFDDDAFLILQKSVPPFSLNMAEKIEGIEDINIQGELYEQFSFVILANDIKSLNIARAVNLFIKADVIQLMVDDLHRVSSAVKDIKERNLFFELFYQNQNKLLLSYSKAAYFQKERLNLMVDEVVIEVGQIFSSEKIHWFIYENFEVRYNFYNQIAMKMKKGKLKADDCLKQWKSLGIPVDEPFNEKVLIERFTEIEENMPIA